MPRWFNVYLAVRTGGDKQPETFEPLGSYQLPLLIHPFHFLASSRARLSAPTIDDPLHLNLRVESDIQVAKQSRVVSDRHADTRHCIVGPHWPVRPAAWMSTSRIVSAFSVAPTILRGVPFKIDFTIDSCIWRAARRDLASDFTLT